MFNNDPQAKQDFLFSFYDRLFARVLNDKDEELTELLEEASAALIELEEAVDAAITLLEQLPDLDDQDLICSSIHSPYAQRFKGVRA